MPSAAIGQSTVSLEPGQAEERTTATAVVDTPTTWARPAKEARAIWISGGELLQGSKTIRQMIFQIADANFNSVMLDTWLRGYVIYPGSQVVPQLPDSAKLPEDVLGDAIEAAHSLGLRADAWPEYGFYAYHTRSAKTDSSRGPLLDRHPHLTAKNAAGGEVLHNPSFGDYYSLCPANPESHGLLGSIIAETVTKYPFDGVNLDRLRFPAADYCYCDWCRTSFARDSGFVLAKFDHGTTEARKFLHWKREQNARAVATIRELIHKARPGLPITAYVVGPDEMDDKAQSWDLWVKRGLVDAVAVSMYGPDLRATAQRAIQLLDRNTSALVCAISCDLPHPSYYLRNIGFARGLAPRGQFTWYSGKVQDDLPALKSGPYAAPAQWPW